MAKGPFDIALEKVSVTLEGNVVLDEVDTRIQGGQLTAIIGPNGSGKTTLLKAMMGLIPYRGRIRFCAESPCDCKPVIGYVPQRLDFDRGTPLTVAEFMIMDSQRRPLWLGVAPRLRSDVALQLQRVGYKGAGTIDKRLGALSGGELQRVMLAKALLRKPTILLCDEPVANVDIAGEELFCDLLEHLQQESHFTLIMVSHDLSIVSRHAKQVLCLNRKLVCHGSVAEVITQENIQKIYGVHMGFHEHHHG